MMTMASFTHDRRIATGEAGGMDIMVLREGRVHTDSVELQRLGRGATVQDVSVQYVCIPSNTSLRIPEEAVSVDPSTDPEGIPRCGVSVISWSLDERYLATRHEAMPAAVWVWNISQSALVALLIHRTAVRDVTWKPSKGARDCPVLAVATADSRLFFWSPGNTEVVASPMSGVRLQWRSDGHALLLQERERACVYLCHSPLTQSP